MKSSPGLIIALVFTGILLAGCDNSGGSSGSVPNLVTGVVLAPGGDSSQFVASADITDPIGWLASTLTSTAEAAVGGVAPVAGATVELVRLDGQGNVLSVLATDVTNSSGVYNFVNTPAPDSTLAVRVTGQTDTMRAIVTGPQITISPTSETIYQAVKTKLTGGVTLGNFTIDEIAALEFLVEGLDVNLTGMTFAQSVTAMQTASGTVLANLVSGFSTPGVETVLYNSRYGGLDFVPAYKDPNTLGGLGKGGIEIQTRAGGFGFLSSGIASSGTLTGFSSLHNLASVEQPAASSLNPKGLLHVVTANGQVIVGDNSGNSSAGAVTADGSFMVYPLGSNESAGLSRGIRLLVHASDAAQLANGVLDPAAGGTDYHLVGLKETLSGLTSDVGENLAAVAAQTGTLTFDSTQDLNFPSSDVTYNKVSGTLTSNRRALSIDTTALTSSTTADTIDGGYYVFNDGSVLMKNADETFLGQGYATSNGQVLAYSTSKDQVQLELDVLANDSDVDVGNGLTITSVSSTTLGGTAVASANGKMILYVPPANVSSGTENFTYTVSDGTSSSSGDVSLNFTATNTPPAVADDDFRVFINSLGNALDVLENDTDPDLGAALTITDAQVVTPMGTTPGIVSISSNSDRLIYSPPGNATGKEVLSYTVSDGTVTATAQVTIMTVLPSGNSAPTAADDSGIAVDMNSVNQFIDVLANDKDLDAGDTLTITNASISAPLGSGGAVSVVTQLDKQMLSYTPPANESGTEVLTYTVSDSNSASDSATVTVNVIGPVNTAPIAVDDAYNVAAGSNNNVLDVRANDHDNDVGDTFTITQVAAAGGGTVTTDGTSLTYSPASAFTGPETLSYTISDGNASDTATVTVTTVTTNTAPVAGDDASFHVGENSSGNVLDVLANDSDADVGDTLNIISADSASAQGGTVINLGDTISYTPAANFSGSDSFSYTMGDIAGSTDTATVTVTVMPANVAPDAVDDSGRNVVAGRTVTVDVLANDSDTDVVDTLTIVSAQDPGSAGGTVTNNSGNLTYTPVIASGPETFTYTVSDGAATDTATVTVNVVATNDAPTAVNDSYTVGENSSGSTLAVLANDSDLDLGDTLMITAVGARDHGGTAAPSGDNKAIIYSPLGGYSGPETFTYTIDDGNGGTANATVTVSVSGANTQPVAGDDSYSVGENSTTNPLAVLANDSDADVGDTAALTITAASIATALGSGGAVSINGANDGLIYTPPANTSGTETLSYTISDGNGGTDTATVTMTVLPTNNNTAPAATDDSGINVAQGSSNNAINVLANDTDSDLPAQTLTITGVSGFDNGGSATFTASSISYTPAVAYTGIETFSYAISDGNGGTDTATVSVTVVAGDTPPVAVDDSGIYVIQDTANNPINVLANDSDPDVGQSLTITSASISTPLGAGGTVAINGTNDGLLYDPPAGEIGNETLQYTIDDGQGGTANAFVTVTVLATGSNTSPFAANDSYSVAENSSNTLAVLANDSDPDVPAQTLTIQSVGATNHGGSATTDGSTITYAPASGFSGTETFTYTISDGTATANANVTMTVIATNSAPIAIDDGISPVINVQYNSTNNEIDALANDTDPDVGDAALLTISSADNISVAGGTITFNGVGPGNTLYYTPQSNYSGPDQFQYVISDGTATASATVHVTVLASGSTNTNPTAANDSYSVGENSTNNTLTVLANDSDPDLPAQTLTITGASIAIPLGGGGTVSVNGTNNGLIYSPPADASGTETLSYTISDANGGTANATVTITVLSTIVNNNPVAVNDAYSVGRNSTGNALAVLANDSDPDVPAQTLTITGAIIQTPLGSGGTVTINGTSNGLIYTPPANQPVSPAPTGTETISYTVSDGSGGTDTATVTMTVVAPENTLPTAVDDDNASNFTGFTVALDTTGNPLDVLANDIDADVGDALTVTLVSNGVDTNTLVTTTAGGSVGINGPNGTLLYTPLAGFSGNDSFDYIVSDGRGTSTAHVTVTVNGHDNSVPTAVVDSGINVLQNSSNIAIDVLANDLEPDLGDVLTITAASVQTPLAGGGTVSINGTNDGLLYTPPAGQTGTEVLSYTITDGKATDTATVTVNVVATNTAPVAADDTTYRVQLNSTGNALDVLTNDSDPDLPAQALTITAASIATALDVGGTVTINGTADGLVYTPPPGATGTETLSYTVSDGNGGTDTAAVTVTVVAGNQPPDAVDDTSYHVAVDSIGNVLDVLENDSDPDLGDSLTILTVQNPGSAGGTVTRSGANNTLIYTPAATYAGTETFTYTVSDGHGTTDQGTVTVTVSSTNTAPQAVDDTSWTYVVPDTLARIANLANREIGVAIRKGTALGNNSVSGTYNVVQHAGYLSLVSSVTTAASGYKFGNITFNGTGNVTGGQLSTKYGGLDIDKAKAASEVALLVSASDIEAVTGGDYTVSADGTITLTNLLVGTTIVNGSGAVSPDGEVIALSIRIAEGGNDVGRGLLFLVRQH